jgi:purine catabolism regulator
MRHKLPRRAAVVVAQGPKALLEEALEQLEDVGELAELRLRAGVVELTAALRGERVRKFAEHLAAGGGRVGGGEVTTLPTLPRSHQTARHSVEMTSEHSPVVTWDQTVNEGVMSLVSSDRAAAFGERWLAPIESEPEGIFVETLRSLLTNHGSLLKVAADLGIHRNTVRHRVERIQTLLGRSLDDPQVRVDAWVALQGRSTNRGDHRTR